VSSLSVSQKLVSGFKQAAGKDHFPVDVQGVAVLTALGVPLVDVKIKGFAILEASPDHIVGVILNDDPVLQALGLEPLEPLLVLLLGFDIVLQAQVLLKGGLDLVDPGIVLFLGCCFLQLGDQLSETSFGICQVVLSFFQGVTSKGKIKPSSVLFLSAGITDLTKFLISPSTSKLVEALLGLLFEQSLAPGDLGGVLVDLLLDARSFLFNHGSHSVLLSDQWVTFNLQPNHTPILLKSKVVFQNFFENF